MNMPVFTILADTVAQPKVGLGALAALGLFVLASMWIGWLANRATSSSSFMTGFFLGNRGLGSWALALTATVQSGGTFMGFPSLVYTHGWSVALWICGYMMVPLTGFGILGKRLAQISRMTGAITVPDLFRARFNCPKLGLLASLFIMFYMSFMMVAQFKAGAIVMKLAFPSTDSLALVEDTTSIDTPYYIGLAVFALTVVGYTLMGGFLAAVWTDLFQSVMMWLGVLLLLYLAVTASGGPEAATLAAINNPDIGAAYAFAPGFDPKHEGREFLPVSLGASFFALWVLTGLGSPAGMVRIMACRDTGTIRRSIFLLAFYNACIYLPLVVICICGRSLIPNLEKSDEIIPRLALMLTSEMPFGSFIAGLILAAPFGAVMATVSSYLVVIASGLVRDVYQRFINPNANEYTLSRLSYAVMIVVGLIAILANIWPVAFLQAIVVFSGSGAGATFLFPALMLAYWRRATVPGVVASMIVGGGLVTGLYAIGIFGLQPDQLLGQVTKFRPYFLLGIDPLIWGLLGSISVGVIVTLLTKPPDDEVVGRFFEVRSEAPGSPAVSG
jgi:sodium/pantothenate symporter